MTKAKTGVLAVFFCVAFLLVFTGTRVFAAASSAHAAVTQDSLSQPVMTVARAIQTKTKIVNKDTRATADESAEKPVEAAGTDTEKPVDDEESADSAIEGSHDEAAQEPSKEDAVFNSMVKNDFPEKTDFIVKEDLKNGVKLGEKPQMPLNTVVLGEVPKSSFNPMFMKMMFTTLALGVVVVLLALLWKWLQKKSGGLLMGGKGAELKIIAQQMISPKSRVLIVDALGKKYLVGATESNISLLADIDFYASSGEVEFGSIAEKKYVSRAVADKTSASGTDQPAGADGTTLSGEQASAAMRVREKLKGLKKLA
ncbi:MAG: flagellar biosynthetic protein FliO [Deltaproteobacteria bacterium]|nr:flagellar biosynthetic protein FliO [Deltaproteobacteria bacterium]